MRLILFAILALTACAPLNPQSTPTEKVGEAVGRTVLCPLTLCFSELGFYQNYKNEQKQIAYEQWRGTLTPEQQDQEDRRQAEAARSLAITLTGRPVITRPQPAAIQQGNNAVLCATNQAGQTFYTNCR